MVIPALQNLGDNCSYPHEITVNVLYDGGYLETNGGIAPIPVGNSEVTYVVYDARGNTSTAVVQATIEDQTPPVTVCDQNTTVGLTNGGEAYVNAITFDDGSYDDCALESFVVRRMEEVEGQEAQVACQPCKVPEFTEKIAGIDFGYAAPACILNIGVDKDNNYWIMCTTRRVHS